MRRLRIQSEGKQIRVFYALDPRRTTILLIGDDKTGNERFYEKYVPIADRLLFRLKLEALLIAQGCFILRKILE
jgi:hypothetical protein